MKTILLMTIIMCLVAMPAMAFDVMVGTDYNMEDESFLMIAEVSEEWQELEFGINASEDLMDILNTKPKLNNINLFANMKIDENLTIGVESRIIEPVQTTVKVRYEMSY